MAPSRTPVALKFLLYVFVLGLLSVPLLATPTVELKRGSENVDKLGKGSCTSSNKISVVLPAEITNKYSSFRAMIKKAAKDSATSSCPSSISTNQEQITFSKNGSIEENKLLPGSACASQDSGDEGAVYLCVYPGTEESLSELVAEKRLSYNTKEGKIDTVKNKSAFNKTAVFTVEISDSETVDKLEICYGKTSDGNIDDKDCPTNFKTTTSKPPDVVIENLENNKEYGFKIRPIGKSGSKGAWGESFKLTPIPAGFPLNIYEGKGGDITYSCQNMPKSSLFLFFVMLFLLLFIKFRKQVINSNLICFLSLIFIINLFSQDLLSAPGDSSFGLLGSMYRPDLDNELKPDGEKIAPFYGCFFRRKTNDKKGKINPLLGFEMDWTLVDGFGALKLGLGLGYSWAFGKACELDENNKPICNKPINNTKISLHMYQIRPQLTYLFDLFKDDFPLVPYGRASLIAHGYSFMRNGKSAPVETNNQGKIKPHGIRFGWQAGLGLMLMLDFLEPSAVASAYSAGFFEHVYLKTELSYTKINTFGHKGFNFSSDDVMGSGLPLMWNFGLVFDLL